MARRGLDNNDGIAYFFSTATASFTPVFVGTIELLLPSCLIAPKQVVFWKVTGAPLIMENNKFIILISSTFATPKQLSEQSRAISMLQTLRFPYDVIDASDAVNREVRDGLFEVSGVHAKYPQFFIVNNRHVPSFVGNFDKIEGINDASRLPLDTLQDNPSIITWNSLISGEGIVS